MPRALHPLRYSCEALGDKGQGPGSFWKTPKGEGNPVDEGTTQRGTDTLVHHPEKPAGSTYSSTSGLSPLRPPERLERQAEFRYSHDEDLREHLVRRQGS